MKPKSLLLVLILGWIAVGVTALVELIFLIGLLRVASYGYGGAGLLWVFWVLALAAIGVLAAGQLLVTQRRQDLGRWLFVGGAGGYLLVQIIGMASSGYGGGGVDILLFIIALGLMVATGVFLFMPDMNAWLGKPGLSNMMSGYGGQQPQQQRPTAYNPQPTGWGAPAQPTQFPPQPASPDVSQPVSQTTAFSQPTGYPPVPGQADLSQPVVAATTTQAPPADVSQPTGAMRTCPYCAEQIRAEAVKCRYCGSEVTPTA